MWKCPKCGRTFKNTNQDHYCGEAPATIEEYIERQPEQVRPRLRQINDAVRAAIPDKYSRDRDHTGDYLRILRFGFYRPE